jgi:hypothetical protein
MQYAILLSLLAAAPAAADTSFIIKVSNRVTEVEPSATVELWAQFDEQLHGFCGAKFAFHASPDAGSFSNQLCILDDPGTAPGEVSPDGDSVTDVTCGQLCFPVWHCPEDRSNPILVWRVEWSTEEFSPRLVALATASTLFLVYTNVQGDTVNMLHELVEGAGLIEIGCYADCTGDESLDLFDFLCFVNQFNAGAQSADCDGNESFDLFDFLCFVNRFNAGC